MAEVLSSPEVIGPVGNNPITNMQQRFAKLPQKNKMGILIGVPLLIVVIRGLFPGPAAAKVALIPF